MRYPMQRAHKLPIVAIPHQPQPEKKSSRNEDNSPSGFKWPKREHLARVEVNEPIVRKEIWRQKEHADQQTAAGSKPKQGSKAESHLSILPAQQKSRLMCGPVFLGVH